MEWTFVLKDKGTRQAGWWLKISTADELIAYWKQTYPVKYGKVFENYVYGKEFDGYKCHRTGNMNHSPWLEEEDLTFACAEYAANKKLTIWQGIQGMTLEVAMRQLEKIRDYGAIFINRRGGYHTDYDGHHEYPDFVHRKELIFPDFKSSDIRIKQFPGGEHYYAYIGDTQVRDGDTLKWSTRDEAYKKALEYANKKER